MNKKYREDETGVYQWVKTDVGGYWSKIEDEDLTKERIPLACSACKQLMYNLDNNSFYRYSVCMECEIEYIENRNLSEDLIKNRSELIKHIQEKIEQNKNKR